VCDRQTDRQTDGIAIASTALAMQTLQHFALQHTVKKPELLLVLTHIKDYFRIASSHLVTINTDFPSFAVFTIVNLLYYPEMTDVL